MAAVRGIVTVEDSKSARSQIVVHFPTGLALVDYEEALQQFITLVDTMIGGVVRNASINMPVALPGGIASSAQANTDVEEGARWIFVTANGYNTALRIPTFGESRIDPNSRVVDSSDTDVIAFDNYMLAGYTAPTNTQLVEPTDYREDDITSVASRLESFQRSRR